MKREFLIWTNNGCYWLSEPTNLTCRFDILDCLYYHEDDSEIDITSHKEMIEAVHNVSAKKGETK